MDEKDDPLAGLRKSVEKGHFMLSWGLKSPPPPSLGGVRNRDRLREAGRQMRIKLKKDKEAKEDGRSSTT